VLLSRRSGTELNTDDSRLVRGSRDSQVSTELGTLREHPVLISCDVIVDYFLWVSVGPIFCLLVSADIAAVAFGTVFLTKTEKKTMSRFVHRPSEYIRRVVSLQAK